MMCKHESNGRKVSVKRPCDAKQGAVTLSFPSCLRPRIGGSKTYGTVWQVWSDGQSCSAHISELWLWKLQKIYILRRKWEMTKWRFKNCGCKAWYYMRENVSARTHMCLNLYGLLSCYIYFAFPSSCEGTLMTVFFPLVHLVFMYYFQAE